MAIDGSKIAADASKAKSRNTDGLRAVARRLIDEAARADEDEDACYGGDRGDALPEALRDPVRREQIIDDLVKKGGRGSTAAWAGQGPQMSR